MGTFIKVLIIVIVLALGSLFVIKGHDGKALVSVDDLMHPDKALPEVAGKIKAMANPDGAARIKPKTKVYSWIDEQGNQHYSNQPPPENVASAEQITINPDMNVIASDKKPEEGEEGRPKGGAVELSNLSDNASVYSEERVNQEIDKVRQDHEARTQ